MEIHKQEFHVRKLQTRSVTLFPTRAQIVRDVKGVSLKPGTNQITIIGLTPTVDENSIKVEGTGSATITDIAVESLPNRDIFQEIYPDSDSDDSSDESSDDDDDDDLKDGPELKAVRDKLTDLRDAEKRARELVASAEKRLKFLDSYGNTIDKRKNVQVAENIEDYRKEREKVFEDHMAGTVRERELGREILELVKDERRLRKLQIKEQQKIAKVKAKARKSKDKEKAKERRRDAEKAKEKARIRKEREHFWPRNCFTVRITLEANTFTPGSSRRTSIASATDLVKAVPEKDPTSPSGEAGDIDLNCDLSLTYVTASAFWSPSYDLALSTTSNTATLCFDAKLTNTTSETWSSCKVTLSTSQTTFAGLEDTIPTLAPWRVKLARGYGRDLILNSQEEKASKQSWVQQQHGTAAWASQKPRNQLFGVDNAPPVIVGGLFGSNSNAFPPPPPAAVLPAPVSNTFASAPAKAQAAPGGSAFGQPRGGGLFGASSNVGASDERARVSSFSQPIQRKMMARRSEAAESEEYEGGAAAAELADDGATMIPEPDQDFLDFQDSSFEETGLTTTYDLPGVKTLAPGSTASKQRVARIAFSGVAFSHTVVAKHKPAAFLKARLRNTSKLTLLKGAAGLTLDGSFMGRATLPRCSAGESFTMNLGIDPAIRVVYPKPDVKRSQSGLFSKEDSSVYTRSVTLENTRAAAGKPVTIVVLDQVPVSEDDKLRIEILQPRGVTAGGVATGVPGKDGKDNKEWGKAAATLKKGGEISWDVTLNAGKSVKLPLEYEVALPAGEGVAQCY